MRSLSLYKRVLLKPDASVRTTDAIRELRSANKELKKELDVAHVKIDKLQKNLDKSKAKLSEKEEEVNVLKDAYMTQVSLVSP